MFKPELPKIPENEAKVCRYLLSLFQIEGQPANLVATEGQLAIFHAIVFRPHPFIQIITCTQYGKSLFVSLGAIVVSCIQEQLVPIVAPKKEQAKIIMRYYIEHMGDHPMFYTQLEKGTKLERLRQEESKERIVLRGGGGVYALSVDAGSSKGVQAAMGQGAKIIISDESGLIPDEIEATIFRMMAGKGADICYIKIGNPFYTNHFKRSWYDNDYYRIFIDAAQALKEGRYTQAFYEKAMRKPLAEILYSCEFPDEDEMDANGYRRLLKSDEYALIFTSHKPEIVKNKRLGVDVARGGDWNAYVIRGLNKLGKPRAYVIHRDKCRDLMATAAQIIKVAKDEKIPWEDVFVDDAGVGGGVVDRIREKGHRVNACQEGSVPTGKNAKRFANAKAEANYAAKDWFLHDKGRVYGTDFEEAEEIKYKLTSKGDGKIIMESKEELRKRGIKSPDFWDALCLTFYGRTIRRPSIRSL